MGSFMLGVEYLLALLVVFWQSMRGSRKFFQRVSNFENLFFVFFLVNEWIQIPLKSGHHRPASDTPFKWRFAGVAMMAQH